MSIYDYLKERESKQDFNAAQDKAEKMFMEQKESIKEIKDSKGFQEICEFWQREKESAIQRIATAKGEDASAKAMYILADRFLKYLAVRLSG